MSRAAALSTGWRRKYGSWASPSSDTSASLPEHPIVELWLGTHWEDISKYVLYTGDSSIDITSGRSGEGSKGDPSSCRMTLKNMDGRFSERLATGPYYGKIGRNTPIRVSVIRNGHRWFRFYGEVSQWPVTGDISGNFITVTINAFGPLHRIQQNQESLESALLRFIRAGGPVECWPMTDGATTTLGALPLNNSSNMKETVLTGDGVIAWGSASLAPWLEPIAEVPAGGTGYFRGTTEFSSTADTGGWRFDFCRTGDGDLDSILISDRGLRTDNSPQIMLEVEFDKGAGEVRLSVISHTGAASSTTLLDNETSMDVWDTLPHSFRVTVAPSGGNMTWSFHIDGTLVGSGVAASITPKAVAKVEMFWDTTAATGENISYGFLTYWAGSGGTPLASTFYSAMNGFVGETAAARLARLCSENSIAFTRIATGTDETAAMGPQDQGTLEALLRECEDADLGLLYESKDFLGLSYRERASLFNQDARLALDYSNHELGDSLNPSSDDRNLMNKVTVNQLFGSSYTVEDSTTRLGTAAPPTGVGPMPTSASVSLQASHQLPNHAGWLLHLGTVDESRYPKIALNLRHSTFTGDVTMMGQVLTLDAGERITVDNTPAWWPPETIAQLVVGTRESLGVREHDLILNCVPASPYDVAVFDSGDRIDTAGSVTMSDLTETATSFPVNTTVGARWFYTDNPALPNPEHPFDVMVGGEVMTVTDTTSILGDLFSRVEANGWGVANSGQTWTSSGGVAADYATSGGTATITVSSLGLRAITAPVVTADCVLRMQFSLGFLPTGDNFDVFLVQRRIDSNNFYSARVRISTAGVMTLSLRKLVAGVETQLSTFTTAFTYVANDLYDLEFYLVGSTLQARTWKQGARMPDYQTSTTDTSFTAPGSAGPRINPNTITNVLPVTTSYEYVNSTPQLFTVTRSTNGVVKSHSSGADVRLFTPTYLSY